MATSPSSQKCPDLFRREKATDISACGTCERDGAIDGTAGQRRGTTYGNHEKRIYLLSGIRPYSGALFINKRDGSCPGWTWKVLRKCIAVSGRAEIAVAKIDTESRAQIKDYSRSK
ncbi:hypothetical protein EVAR_8144_1 [Eumeta japonica]|uniref:Uncharacterized protein n=1 Tax=Eumeta variegata TaxID=151549 RepID=A0A4C1TSX2_EUMVA|nr:hypothetical protein EVAR_8144_1 [Eumeta japonica]